MAGCGGKKKMAYGGKVKKMQEGGMAAGNTQAEIEKLNQRIEMLRRQAEEQARAVPQRSRLGGVPGDMRALAPQGGASLGGMKKGGKVMNEGMKALKKEAPEVAAKMGYKKGGAMKKGYHKMPDGKMMKDSAHKGMKKMKSGGKVKRDGCATKGKTKGRMV